MAHVAFPGLQVLVMVAEALFLAVLFVACFAIRPWIGLVPLYAMLGVVYNTASFLAGTVYIQITPGIVVSPGSVAYFPSLIFAVLAVYIIEDALEARRLIYGLLVTNICMAAVGFFVAMHLRLPQIVNSFALSPDLFSTQPRILTTSLLATFADTLLIVVLYEWLSRFIGPLFLRIYAAMALTLVFDTLLFVTGIAVEQPHYGEILLSATLGKLFFAVIYAVVLSTYLHWFAAHALGDAGEYAVGETFSVLTYRQRFEQLQARASKDALTGLYNRGFLDEILSSETSIALRSGRTLAILMCDVDNFKRINDTAGHVAGDEVLRKVAGLLAAAFRTSDYVCRYGGEEFLVVLPNTDLDNAVVLAERARDSIATATDVTITIGIACLPEDGLSPKELLGVADHRLYSGKQMGRNCVVATPGELPVTA